MQDNSQAIYLYCLGRSNLVPAIEGTGLDGQNLLFLHKLNDIVAVLGKIHLGEFCGPLAQDRMRDLSWLGPRACHHEKVVEHTMRHSPVLPARFATIFTSLETLEKFLRTRYGTIIHFLDRVAEQEEWSVKGLVDRVRAKKVLLSASFSKEAGRLSSMPPGIRYFEEQRIRGQVDREFSAWLKKICKEIAGDLTHCASDFSERKPLAWDIVRKDVDIVSNWAFLVPRKSVTAFRLRVNRANEEHEEQGLAFTLSGPWPPYSFCPSLDVEER